jgi:hypothetical protein
MNWNVELISVTVLLLLTHQKDGVSPEFLLEQVNPCHVSVL